MKRIFWVEVFFSECCIDVQKKVIDLPIIREWTKVRQYAVQDHIFCHSPHGPIARNVHEALKGEIFQGPVNQYDDEYHYIAQGGFIYEDPGDDGEMQILVSEAKRRYQLNATAHYKAVVADLHRKLDQCLEKVALK